MERMEAATSFSPTLTTQCEINSGGGAASSTTCYWSFALDDGRSLSWPWPNQNGSAAQRTR
ncbi:MAG: hypothetical protein M3291_13595, partial [Actinomycetota bacterium]|nr:hypothetical protein [Actinomycetota bacterium]